MPASIKPRRSWGLARGLAGGSGLGASAGGTATFAAFSSPTSISTLIVSSLRVSLFHLSDGTCKVRPSLIKAIQRGNLVIVRSGQGILGGDHFNVVGDSGPETVTRLIHLLFRELHAEVGDLNFIAGGLQVQQGGFHVESNLVAEIGLLLLQFLQFEIGLSNFRLNAPTGENGHVDGGLVLVGRDAVIDCGAKVSPVAVETEGRQALVLRRLLFQLSYFFPRLNGLPFFAAGEG